MGSSSTILFLCPHNAAKGLLAVADFDGLPASPARVERWDDVPPVSQDLGTARDTILHHLGILLDDLGRETLPSPTRP